MAKTPSANPVDVQQALVQPVAASTKSVAPVLSAKAGLPLGAKPLVGSAAVRGGKKKALSLQEEEALRQEEAAQAEVAAQADAVPVAETDVLLAQAGSTIPPGAGGASAVLVPPAASGAIGAAGAGAGAGAAAASISWGTIAAIGAGVAAVAGAGGSSGGSTPPPAPAPAPVNPPAPAPQPEPEPEPEPNATVHQLTAGLDNVQGGAGVDRILGSSTTFQPADVVNGGEGVDTLQLQLTGGTYGDGAIVSNIEVLDVRALAGDSGAVNLYLTDWDDSLTKLNIIEAKQDVAVRDQQTLADVSITKSNKNVDLAYEPNVTAGEDDELNVSVSAFKGGLTIDDQVEGVRLSVDDDAGLPNASNMSINALSSMTIVGGRSGQGFGLTLTGEDGSAASLDSSEFVGNLTLDAGSNLKTLTTGVGDDVVTSTSGIYQSDAVYDLGEGNNSLNVSGTVGGSVIAGAGNDTISISGSVNEGASIDMGAGNNTLTAGVIEGAITSGSGADSITVDGIEGAAVVSLGDGDNEVVVGAHGIGEGASLTLGDGNNSVHTAGGVYGVMGEDSEGGVSITFGDGNNSFLVATELDGDDVPVGGAGVDHANIVFGDGDNRMDVATQVVNSSVTFGDGDNILQVVGDVRDSSVSFGDGQNAVLLKSDLEGSSVAFGSGDGNVLGVGEDVVESAITFAGGSENELLVYGEVVDSSATFGNGDSNVMYVDGGVSGSTVSFGTGDDNMLLVGGGVHNTSVSFAGGSADANIAGQVTSGDGVVSEFSFAGDGNTMDVNAFGGEDSNGIEGHVLTTVVGEDTVSEEVRVNIDFGAGSNNTLLVRNGSVQLADISFGEGSANNVGIDKNLQNSSVTFGGEDSTGGAGNGLYVGNDIRNSQVAFFGAASTVQVGDDVTASQLSFGAGANQVQISDDLEDGSSISMTGGGSRVYVGGDVEGSSISISGGGNSGQMAAVGEDAPNDAGVFVSGDVDASSITVGGGNNDVYVGEDVIESTISLTGEAGEDTLSVGDDIVDSTVSFAGAGNVLSVGDDVEGSSLSFAAGGNTVTVGGDVEQESEITLAGGGSVVSIGDDLDNSTVAMGDGGNSVNVGGQLDDGALISATAGDNTVVVGGKVSDGSQINLGSGSDTVTVGSNEHKQGSVGGDGGQKAAVDMGAGDDQLTLSGSKHYGNTLVRSGGELQGGEGNDTLTIKAASDVNVVGRTEHQELSVELAENYAVGDVVTLKVGEEEFAHTVEYTTAQVLEFTFGGSYSYSADQTYSVTIDGETYSFLFPGAQGGPGAAAQAVADGIKSAIQNADPSIEGFGSVTVVAGEVEGTYTLSLTGTTANAENVDASSSHSAAAGADGAERTVQTAGEVASALESLVNGESTTFSASIVDGQIVLTGNGCTIAADVTSSLWLNEGEVEGAITTEQLADASISGFETLKLEILNNVGEDTGLTAREITADFSYISGVQNIVLDSQVKIDAVTVDTDGEVPLINGTYQQKDEYADNCDVDGTTEFNLLNLKGGEAITVSGHEVTATGSQQVDRIHVGDQDEDHKVGDVISVTIGDQTYSMEIIPADLDGESAVADANAIATRLAGILQEATGGEWPFTVAVDGNVITLVGTDPSLSASVDVSHVRPQPIPYLISSSWGDAYNAINFDEMTEVKVGDSISLTFGSDVVSYTVLQEDLDACCDRHIADVLAEKMAAALNESSYSGARAFFGVVTLAGDLEASWDITRMESAEIGATSSTQVQHSDAADDSDIDVTVKATLAENTDDDTMDLAVDGYGAFDLEIVGDGVGQYEHLDLSVVDEFSHYINTNGHHGNFSESIVLTGGAAGASIYLDNVRAADVNSTSEANLTVEQYDTDLQNALVGEDAVVNVSTGSGDDHLITNAWALVNEGSSVDLGTGKNTLSLGWGWMDDHGNAVPRTIAGADLARVSEIDGLTQLHRLNMLNGVVLGEDATMSMMETSVPNSVKEIDLWAVTVTGEDIDLTISGTAASLLLEASEGDLDLQDTGVLTAVGVTDLSVRAFGDATFALGNDALNTLSVVSRDDEASVYVRDGVNRTVTIGEATLEGRGGDAKFTIRDNTDGSVTVGSLSAEADSDARLAIYDNTNTDISVGELNGVTLRGEYEATVSISGNGDNKLEADQVITLGDLSMYAGEDALVTIESNVANTITLGAVDMVSCEEDTSFRVANNSGLDYEEGMSASVDWSTLNSGAIAMDAGDEASLAIEGNTWAKVELATGEDESIDISARNDIEFKVKDNTNVNVAMGAVTLSSADRISASVSGNVTDTDDLYLSSVAIGDFSATANDDVNLWMKDNVWVDVSLGDVAMTSYTDDVRLYVKDNQDTQFSFGSVALSALDDAALVIRSNVAGEDEGPGVQMLVDGDITITSQEDDATLSFKGNTGVQFGVMGDVSLKAADDVRFELSGNKATLVFMPGSAEGEDSEVSPAIKLESTDGDVRLYIKDNGGEDAQDSFNGFAAVLGTVDIDAKDEAKVKINGNENSLIAVGLPASAVTGGIEGVFSSVGGQILENMDLIQQALSSAGPGIEVNAASIDFEIENNFTSGEDFQDDFNVVVLGSTALTAEDTNDVDAHADARMSILGNEQTIIVAGDLQMSADATSSGEDAYAETGLYVGETGFFGASGSNGVQGNETVAVVMGDVSLESNATTVFDEANGVAYVELSANENVRIKLGDVSTRASATSTNGAAYAGAGVAVLGNIGGDHINGEDDSWIEMGNVTVVASTNPVGEDDIAPLTMPTNPSEARAAIVLMENEELIFKAGDVELSATANGGEDTEAVAVLHLDENRDSSFEFGDVSLSADAKTGFDFAGFSIVDQSNVDVSAGDIKVKTTGAHGLAGVAVGAYSNQGYSYLTGTNQGVDYFRVGLQYTPAATDANYETDVALGNIAVSAGNDAAVWLSADSHGSLSVGNIHVTSATAEDALSGNIFFYMNDVTLNSAVGEDAADHLGRALAAVEAANIAVQDAGSDDVALALAQEALEAAEAEVEAAEAFLNALEDGISIVLDGSAGADGDNQVHATLIDTPDVHSLEISGAYANVFLEGEMDGFATLDLSGVTDFAYVETWNADFSNGSDQLKLSDHVVVKIGSGDLQYNAMYGVRQEGGLGRGFTGSLVQNEGTDGNRTGDWNGGNSGWYSLGESGDAYLEPVPHEIYIEAWGRPSGSYNESVYVSQQDVYKFTVDGTSYSVSMEKYISGEDIHGEDTYDYRMTDFRIGLSDVDVGQDAFEEALGVASFEWEPVGDDGRFVLTGPADGSALKAVTDATMVVNDGATVNTPMETENHPGTVASDGIGNAVQEVFQFVGEDIGNVVIGGFFAKPVGADNVDGVLRWGDRLDFSEFDLNGSASGMGGRNDLTISVVNGENDGDGGYFSDVLITFNTAGMEDSSILLVGVGNQYSTSTDVITNVTNSIIFA